MEKKVIAQHQEYLEERFTKRMLFKEADHAVFVLNFGPGHTLPEHKHPGSIVYITVLEGSGVMTVAGEPHSVEKGDILHISGEDTFAYAGSSEEKSSLLVTLLQPPSEAYTQNV